LGPSGHLGDGDPQDPVKGRQALGLSRAAYAGGLNPGMPPGLDTSTGAHVVVGEGGDGKSRGGKGVSVFSQLGLTPSSAIMDRMACAVKKKKHDSTDDRRNFLMA